MSHHCDIRWEFFQSFIIDLMASHSFAVNYEKFGEEPYGYSAIKNSVEEDQR